MKLKRLHTAALLLLGVTALISGCRGPKEAKVTTEGKPAPERIVSLSPSTTEFLYAMGLEDKIVAVTTMCDYPPEAKEKPKVGDKTANMEKLLELKPDVVAGHSFVNKEALEKVRAQGIAVASINPRTLDELISSVRQLGADCGGLSEANKLSASMDSRLNKLLEQVQKTDKPPVVLFCVGVPQLWVAGPGTLVDDMIRKAGGVNAGRELPPEFNVMSQEAAVASDPDIIFVTDAASEKYFFSAASWKSVSAVKNNHIVRVNPDLFLRPCPRTLDGFEFMLKTLSEAIDKHP